MNSRDSTISGKFRQSVEQNNPDRKISSDFRSTIKNFASTKFNDFENKRRDTINKISISIVKEIDQEQGIK